MKTAIRLLNYQMLHIFIWLGILIAPSLAAPANTFSPYMQNSQNYKAGYGTFDSAPRYGPYYALKQTTTRPTTSIKRGI